MSKYMDFFYAFEQKPKTKVFNVVSKKHHDSLGQIKWFGRWRCYAFFPTENTVFNSECLRDVEIFIKQLMYERKLKKLKGK